MAKRLDVTVEDLKSKKLPSSPTHRLKPVTTEFEKPERIKILEDSLLSVMLFGGEIGSKINLEVPEDETKLDELSLIFETKFKNFNKEKLEKAIKEMLAEYNRELSRLKIEELSKKAEEYEDDEEKFNDIMREIEKLQKG